MVKEHGVWRLTWEHLVFVCKWDAKANSHSKTSSCLCKFHDSTPHLQCISRARWSSMMPDCYGFLRFRATTICLPILS